MLSLLPQLLTYERFAPLLLRLTIGIIFMHWAYFGFRSGKSGTNTALFVFFAFIGLFFILGLYIQLVAILASIYLIVELVGKIKRKAFLTDGLNYYLILLVIAISLIVTGAGVIAFDLPL